MIANNSLDGNQTGIYVADADGGVNSSGNQIFFNSLSRNSVAGIDNTTALGTPNAVSNWWGNVSGPFNAASNPYGTGSAASGSVSVSPWLGDGTDTSAALGFQPNASPTYTPPTHLMFSTQPGGASLNSPLSPQPVVTVYDANNNVTPWANPQVTMAILNNPGGGVLAGTNPEMASSGAAPFTDLAITVGGGSGYTLTASAPFLTSANSTAFDISNPAPSISSLTPFFARAGGGGFSLTVNGANFVPDSVVEWNGSARTTHYVSASQVTADILASDIVIVGTTQVMVANPLPSGGVSSQLPFRIVVATPSLVYVDSGYSALPNSTPVNFPYSGSGTNIIGYDAFASVQGGASAVAASGTVTVAAGTYPEGVNLAKAMTLLGANQGIAGCSPRSAESLITNSTLGGAAITISSDNVTVDGFILGGTTGFKSAGHNGLVLHNNAVVAGAVGFDLESIFTTSLLTVTLENNCITLNGQLAGSTPTIGVVLSGVAGPQAPLVRTNNVQGAFYGYLLYAVDASVPTVVQAGAVTGVMQGVAVINVDPVTFTVYNPSSFTVDGVTFSGFSGNHPALPNNNIHAGVYVFTGGNSAVITGTITNVSVQGTGKPGPDSAGLYFADFSTGPGARQQISVLNSTVSTNSNRGIFARGTNAAVSITGCTLSGNGFDPYGTGGNDGFGVSVGNDASVSVKQTFIVNPTTVTSLYHVYALDVFDAPTHTLTVTNCSLDNNGNPSGSLALVLSGATVSASGNWWGDNTAAGVASLVSANVDYTPWLDVGTDTDLSTPGFQGNFHTLHVSAASPQLGSVGRIQEAINAVSGSKVIIEAGTYVENLHITMDNLELAGVGAGSVLIYPAFSDPNCGGMGGGSLCSDDGNMILVGANNVTIHDLTLDGDNPALTSGIMAGGHDIDARNGIITDHRIGPWNNLEVYNTVVQNIFLRGIYASSGGSFNFHDNTVRNVQADPGSVAMFNFGGSGVFARNYVELSSDAISANHSSGTQFLTNTVNNSASGVHTDNAGDGGGVADLIQGNIVINPMPGAYGIFTFVPYLAPVVNGNSISGCSVGLAAFAQGAALTPVFSNNNVDGLGAVDSVGAYISTSELGFGSSDITVSFTGNSLLRNATGFYIANEPTFNASATLKGNTISQGGVGLDVENSLTKVLVENNDLTLNSVEGILVANGATVDAGDCTGGNVTGLGTGSGLHGSSAGLNNLTGYGFDNVAPWAINDANTSGQSNVLAYNNNFGAAINIGDVLFDGRDSAGANSLVLYSQSGVVLATAPSPVNVQCFGNIPAGATTLAQFLAQGGTASSTMATISFADGALTPGPVNGTVNRSYTVTDACNNSTVVHQVIAVNDTTPPVISVCVTNRTIAADVNGHLAIPDLTGGVLAADNCGGTVTVTQSPLVGTQVTYGPHTVTLLATDASGNHSQCQATITVIDTTAPAITCPANVTVTVLQDKDPYATGVATATDANGPVTITYHDDPNSLTNCDATGHIFRTWVAVDAANNTNTCLQTITVVDTIAPYFTAFPANITTTNDPGNCSAVVNYLLAAADEGYFQGFENPGWYGGEYVDNMSVDWNDFNGHISRVPSGTDGIISSGGTAHAVIDSTVADPAMNGVFSRLGGYSRVFGTGYRVALNVYIDLNNPAVVHATATSGYAWDLSAASSRQDGGNLRDFIFHAAAYDASGVVIGAGNDSSDDASNRGPDLRLGAHATLTSSGWYTFEWQFRNASGALAVDLNVRDSGGNLLFTQTLSDPGDLISTIVGGHRYLWFTFLAVDKLAIDNTILERNVPVSSSVASGSAFPVGTTIVTNTITDACGNTASQTFTVTVNDVEPPFIPVLTSITTTNDTGVCGAVVNFSLPTNSITDNCGVAGIVATPASGSSFPVGSTLVTVVVTDNHANHSTNTFNVVVNDVELPVITGLPADVIVQTGPGRLTCDQVASWTPPTASDNCHVASFGADHNPGDTFPVGSTLVTYTATDDAGNSKSASFHVIVQDNTPPVIANCPGNIVRINDPNVTTAVVTWPTIVATDNCGSPNVVVVPPSGSIFPAGTTTVQVLATDIHGNTNGCSFTVTINDLPVITAQPVSSTNNAGTTAVFSVSATGTSPLSYQWLKNGTNTLVDGGNVSGSTSNILTLTGVLIADAANYSVVITNVAGTLTSSNASLTVIDPVINTQPVSVTNTNGSIVSFTVVATGTAPLSYQWRQGALNVAGATASTLTLNSISDTDAGSYTVVVSNSNSSVTSAPAILNIIHPPVFVLQPVNQTVNLGQNAAFSVSVNGQTPFTYQWLFNGTNLSGATSRILTLNSVADANAGSYSVFVTNSDGSATSSSATLTIIDPPFITGQPASRTNNAGTTATFTVTATGTTPTYQWFKGAAAISGATTSTLTLLNVSDADAASYKVVLSNVAAVVTSSPATLTVIDPPFITSQPSSRTNNAGTTATFTVVATGTAPSYQWFHGASSISGATAATLTLLNVSHLDAGSYSVVLSNAAAVVTSSSASLTVIDGPAITSQPVSVTTNAGGTVSFSVANGGTAPFTYQWIQNGTNILVDTSNITGSTNTTLTITNVLGTNGGIYTVAISNPAGTVTSSNAILTVIDPIITSQPTGVVTNEGNAVSFSVTAYGTTPLSYQWLLNGSTVAGGTAATLNLTALDAAAGNYTVVVTNVYGSVTSSIATLVVIDPAIVSQPTNVTAFDGSTVTFSVGAVGSPVLTYQWQLDGVNIVDGFGITGSTTAMLTITNVADSDDGTYTVIVTNHTGSVTSAPAMLVTFPPLITSQPESLNVLIGQPASFSVSANGQAPFSYQWQFHGTNVPGATDRIFTIAAAQHSDAGPYDVLVTNPEGTETSHTALLGVYDSPGSALTVQGGGRGTVTVTLMGVPGFNYILQSSTTINSPHWIPVITNPAPFSITITNPANNPIQFYRGVYAP